MSVQQMRVLSTLAVPALLYFGWCFIAWGIVNPGDYWEGWRALYLGASAFIMVANYTCPAWWWAR